MSTMSIRLKVPKIVPIMILIFLLEEFGAVGGGEGFGGDVALVNGLEAVTDGLLRETSPFDNRYTPCCFSQHEFAIAPIPQQ